MTGAVILREIFLIYVKISCLQQKVFVYAESVTILASIAHLRCALCALRHGRRKSVYRPVLVRRACLPECLNKFSRESSSACTGVSVKSHATKLVMPVVTCVAISKTTVCKIKNKVAYDIVYHMQLMLLTSL